MAARGGNGNGGGIGKAWFRSFTGNTRQEKGKEKEKEQQQQQENNEERSQAKVTDGKAALRSQDNSNRQNLSHGRHSGGSGYNSNENTIKISDPSIIAREANSKYPSTSTSEETGHSGSNEDNLPSESTRKRAEATKQYLESLYQQRKSRDRAKQERRNSLERQLKLENKTNTEIEARLKILDVSTTFNKKVYVFGGGGGDGDGVSLYV